MTTDKPTAGRETFVRVPESAITRIGLLLTGASMLATAVFVSGIGTLLSTFDDVIVLSLVLYALSFAFLGLSVCRKIVPHANILILCAVLFSLTCFYYSVYDKYTRDYTIDILSFTHTSAQMVVDGKNPYSVRDRDELIKSADDFSNLIPITKQADGEIVDRLFVYPAGHLIPYVAAVELGLADMRWLASGATLLAIVLLWWQAPEWLRPLAALPILISPDHSYLFAIGGITDPMWLLPLMLSAIALQKKRYGWAAAAYGWASATKQQPWVLAPFLLVWLWFECKDLPLRDKLIFIGRFGATAGAIFLAINLPFMIWNFSDWLSAVLFPFTADLIFDGSGLSVLSRTGIVDWSKSVYTALSVLTFVVLLVSYIRFHDNLKQAVWLAPALIFFFAHRSLQSYFSPWIPLLMLSVYYLWQDRQRATESEPEPEIPAVAKSSAS